jgi:hypothetical protein
MSCHLPPLNLPREFTTSNDTRRDGLATATIRSVYGNATANVYIGFELDGVTKYSNLSVSNPYIDVKLVPLDVRFDCASGGSIIEVHDDGKPISIKVRFSISFFRPKYAKQSDRIELLK